jgi:hypothetical protein
MLTNFSSPLPFAAALFQAVPLQLAHFLGKMIKNSSDVVKVAGILS